MKIRLFSLLIILTGALMAARAQSASESKIDLDKGPKTAAVIAIPYPEEVVEDAVKRYMSKKGHKSDRSKGFLLFRGIKINDRDVEVVDLYFKVERKSRKDKDESWVYLIVGRPGENVGLRTTEDRHQLENGKELLNSMVTMIKATGLEAGIAEQEELVRKEERRLKNMEEEQRELENRIKNLEEKIQESKLEQRKQADELSKQRATLEGLKARRKA